jgi:cytochrome c5
MPSSNLEGLLPFRGLVAAGTTYEENRRTVMSSMQQHRRVAAPAPWLVTLLIATACGGQPQDSTSPADAASAAPLTAPERLLLESSMVALPPAGTRPDDLPDPQSAGAGAIVAYCTACHALPSPAMHSATDWPGVVRRMWLRMDLLDPRHEVPIPGLGERIVLLDYLTGNALRVSTGNLPDAPGRDLFEATCHQCHELPDPRQHSAQDWYVVVRRMNQHSRDILGRELTASQIDGITRYLSASPM